MQASAIHIEPALHISNLPGNYFTDFPRAAWAHIFNFCPNRSVLQRVCKPFNRLIKTTPANKLFINITEHTDIEMVSKMIANSRSPKVTILVNRKNEKDLSALFHQIDERSNQHVEKLCVSTVAIEKISNTEAFLSKICIFFSLSFMGFI